ncbi:MAG: Protein of unknown function precursor containing a C-terminal secretion signal [Bacteroidetes bacterium]|nr:Protein of unknown function precursor containing a C-terminal secretion signal [Bacteroidota bacterium]
MTKSDGTKIVFSDFSYFNDNHKMKRIIICFILFYGGFLKGQQISWSNTVNIGNITEACKIDSDNNGDIYLSGRYSISHSYLGTYLTKYSSNGTIIWSDTTQNSNMAESGGVAVYSNILYTIERIGAPSDIAGVTYSPGMYLIKRDLAGQVQWVVQQNFDSPGDIVTDHVGNIYVAAGVWGNMAVRKYNSSGVLLNTINGAAGYMAIDKWNNLYVIPGNLNKYNPNGVLMWSKPVDPSSKLAMDNLGNCYVYQTGSFMTSSLMKFNSAGSVEWNISLPFDGAHGICCDSNNCVYVAGLFGTNQVSSGVEIRKYDGSANNLLSFQLPNSVKLIPTSLIIKNGALFMAADHNLDYEAYLLKIDLPVTTTFLAKNYKENHLTISPNPSSSLFTVNIKKEDKNPINLKVVDALGKIVYTKIVRGFETEIEETIDLTGFAKGVYILELTSESFKQSRKLIVE